MSVTSISRRLFAGELHFALARFQTMRRVSSSLKKFKEKLHSLNTGSHAEPRSAIFPSVSIGGAVLDLSRDSVAFGFNLPQAIVNELVDFARSKPYYFYARAQRFDSSEVKNGCLSDGGWMIMPEVCDFMECPAVRQIQNDPVLKAMATRQLGYEPKIIEPRMFWSLACAADDAARRQQGQSIDFHYDVHAFNFCSVNFYLTDVDRNSGAHVLVRGSHRSKPLPLLLSTKATDEEVLRHYREESILVIEGPAGTGFFEDTACFHRIIPPKTQDRLVLEVWFR